MDIKKEREAFEAWFKKEYLGIDNLANQGDEGAITRRDYAYAGWQAAKAQAVQEGFVLVKIDDLELLRDSALEVKYASLNNDSDRIFSDIEDIQLSVERLIEVQEQNQ